MKTQSVFTTFASSRFVDRDAVVAALHDCAAQLHRREPAVVGVHLFGSFAQGTPTPRSDADIVVEIAETDPQTRQRVWQAAFSAFLDAPVPVDLFVMTTERLRTGRRDGRGVAGAVASKGVRLGPRK